MSLFSDSILDRIRSAQEKLIAYAVVRNEILRVSNWISHYRNIGVRQFYIIDNGSTDGTYEFLANQPDIILDRTYDSFSSAHTGIDWLNKFREIAGREKWVLYVDADELIVYDGWPHKSILNLIETAEAQNADAVFGFMLDMYPNGPIENTAQRNSIDLFADAPCFDADYVFKFLPNKPWDKTTQNTVSVIGGPRVRFLSSIERESNVSWRDLFIRGQIDRLIPITPSFLLPTLVRYFPKSMPALHKVPIAKGGTHSRYTNNHRMNYGNYFKQNVVICHFKFLGDFVARIMEDIQRQQHYRRGAERMMYADLIKKFGTLDFRYPRTQLFKSSDQLKDLGLIREMSFSK